MDLFDRVYAVLKADVGRLVEKHFAHMGKGTVKQSVLMIVNDHLDRAATRTKLMIEWLLSVEQVPTTLNTHYFSDYRDKFLAYYRAWRNDNDLLVSKLKRTKTVNHLPSPPGAPSTQTHQDTQSVVNHILSGLSEIGISVKATELAKLLPPDPMEPALNIMASVRAYFQVAYKRFGDMVPMAIDTEIVLGLQRGIDEALQEGLQITGPDGYSRCKSMVEELSNIASTRQEIQKKMERLQAARQELRKLM